MNADRKKAFGSNRILFLLFSICAYLRLSAVPIAFAGSITTLDGKRMEGAVAIDSKSSLLVTPKSGAPARVELNQLLEAEMDSAADEISMSRGVVLSDGTALAAATFRKADANTVTFIAPIPAAEVSIKTVRLAQIVFASPTTESLAGIPGGGSGVLLESGDFVEGEFIALDAGKIKLSSVLFGIQSFEAGRPARVVVLRDARPATGEWLVRLADGSVLPAGSVSFDRTAARIERTPFGTITVPFEQITSIRAGGERVVLLTSLKPIAGGRPVRPIDPGASSSLITLIGLKIPPLNILQQRADAVLTYDLDKHYESFIAQVGVPAHIVPSQRVRFVILLDGEERFRSEERTSVDDAVPVAINLAGGKSLTLRLESAGGQNSRATQGAAAAWVEPRLIRVNSGVPKT